MDKSKLSAVASKIGAAIKSKTQSVVTYVTENKRGLLNDLISFALLFAAYYFFGLKGLIIMILFKIMARLFFLVLLPLLMLAYAAKKLI